jgi:transcriptional regulator with XRE-family HTH domain
MINIGQIIKVNRKRLKLSQEELCFGICSPSNLSKIENGVRVPERIIFKALMERMGLSADIYPSFQNDTDRTLYELQHYFNEAYIRGDYDEAEEALKKMGNFDTLESIYRPLVRLSRVLIEEVRGAPVEAVIKSLELAISLFIKDFNINKIRNGLLTATEVSVLNAYAVAHYEIDDIDTAIKVLYEIVKWVERNVNDKNNFANVYTKVLYNLSKFVGISGDDEEAVRLCNLGIEICLRYGKYWHLSSLLYNKGYGLMQLGKDTEAHLCIRQSYYMDSVSGEKHKREMEITKKFADKNGIQLL